MATFASVAWNCEEPEAHDGNRSERVMPLPPSMTKSVEWDASDQAIMAYLLLEEQPTTTKEFMPPLAPKKKLTAAERRARHREVVRRSYHRNKETLLNLRTTVEQLEAQLQTLRLSPHDSKLKELQAKWAEITSTSDILTAEAHELQTALKTHQAFMQRVQSYLHQLEDDHELHKVTDSPTSVEEDDLVTYPTVGTPTFAVDLSPPAPISTETRQEINYKSLNAQSAQQIVNQTYQSILQFTFSGRYVSTGTKILGWEDKRLIDGTSVKFSLRKSFAGESAVELMAKSWQCFSDPYCVAKRFRGLLQLRVLQRVNDDTVVALRDIVSPESSKVFRCVYLLFRVRTSDGFIICMRSIDDLWGSDVDRSKTKIRYDGLPIQWVDICCWFRFVRLEVQESSDYVNEVGAQVEYGGSMNYNEPSHLSQLVMDTLTVALKWEGYIVAPIFRLPGV